MAYVATDPEKLNKLTEEVNQKKDLDLNFVNTPADSIERFILKCYAPPSPYDLGIGRPYSYKPAGNFLHRPMLDVPNLHIGMSWFTMQSPFKPKFCQIMERDFYRCLTRVGVQNAQKVCKIYWEDLLECQNHSKARKRSVYMAKVRKQKKIPPISDIPYTAYPPYKPF